MSQGNCTLCTHAHLHEQLGQATRVCRKGPPTPVALPEGRGIRIMAIWPAVDDKMVCDEFQVQGITQ